MRSVIVGVILAVCLSFSPAAQASTSFLFDYSGITEGVGFLDPTYGTARQAALETAASMYSDMFGSHFSNTATITMAVTSSEDNTTDTLASAGANVVGIGTGGFNAGNVIMTKLQTGEDLNEDSLDGSVDVNWANNWHIDPSTPANYDNEEFDFFATLANEFTHTLGFASNIDENGIPFYSLEDDGSGE